MSDEAPATAGKAPDRYIFSASVIGAAAHCHTLYNEKVKSPIQVPALGASVLPSIGGLSKSAVSNFCFQIPYPTMRTSLVSVHRIKTRAEGTNSGTEYRTEIEADIESVAFLDRFHIDSARLYMLSTRKTIDAEPVVTTRNLITGIHLGGASIQVELDDNLLPQLATGTLIEKQIEENPKGALANQIQLYRGRYFFNLVKNLVIDQAQETNKIQPIPPNAVHWDGFGTIFFGEAIVKGDDRQVTLVRVEMDSDVGGSGTVGPGSSNGSAGST